MKHVLHPEHLLKRNVVRFVTNRDPNQGSNKSRSPLYWPKYSPGSPKILEFLDGDVQLKIGEDTYRQAALAYDTDASIHNPY